VMLHTVQVKSGFSFLLLVAAETLDAAGTWWIFRLAGKAAGISGFDPTCVDYTDVSQSPTFDLTLIRRSSDDPYLSISYKELSWKFTVQPDKSCKPIAPYT
jgi:hypothetical protein